MVESASVAHKVVTPHGSLSVTEYPGDGPAFVLLHGFPDDSKIYDKLVSELRPRRVVTIDFLGYGKSERSQTFPLGKTQRLDETAAVINQLELDQVFIVGHDSSGAVAIDYALAYPERVARIGLMNCYYGSSSTQKFPEMIRLLADPHLVPLADAIFGDLNQRKWILQHTAKQFGYEPDADIRVKAIIPQYFGSESQPDSLAAIRAWTARLFEDVEIQNEEIAAGKLSAVQVPVDVTFGSRDQYLNTGVAEHLAGLFPNGAVHLIDARHWVQWDQPRAVAETFLQNR